MRSALIIGRANGVWDEVHDVRTTYPLDTIIAINSAGCHYDGHLEHWVSYHAELFPNWMALRGEQGYPAAGNLWTARRGRQGDWERKHNIHLIDSEGGSSAMIAVRVAISLGYERVILAGVPLDNERGHFDQKGDWDEAQFHRTTWMVRYEELAGKVKSMSGWTRGLLGPPTLEWFNGIS